MQLRSSFECLTNGSYDGSYAWLILAKPARLYCISLWKPPHTLPIYWVKLILFVLKQSAHFKFFFCLKLVPFVSLTCSHSHLCLLIFPIQQCNLIACFQNCVKIWICWAIKTSLYTRQGYIGTYFGTVEIAWVPNQKPKWFFLKK